MNEALRFELGERAYHQWAIGFPLLAREYSRQVLMRLSPASFVSYFKLED